MAEIVEEQGKIQPLPAELQFLNDANTTDIIRWINAYKSRDDEGTLDVLPAMWRAFEERIQQHPHEVKEVKCGQLPIHKVLRISHTIKTNAAVPLSVVLRLVSVYPEGLHIQDAYGNLVIHHRDERFTPRQHAKLLVILELVTRYGYIPSLPSKENISVIESHQARAPWPPRFTVLHFPNQVVLKDVDGRLPLHFVLHSNLGASVRALVAVNPGVMFIEDPVSGLFPIEQALLNVGNDGSLGNVDAVDALVRADPNAFLERIVW